MGSVRGDARKDGLYRSEQLRRGAAHEDAFTDTDKAEVAGSSPASLTGKTA